jgi:hypothetical protein
MVGRWREALEYLEYVPEEHMEQAWTFLSALPGILVARGAPEEAARFVSLYDRYEDSLDIQERIGYRAAKAVVMLGDGRAEEALAVAGDVVSAPENFASSQDMKTAFPVALDAALVLGDRRRADQLLDQIETTPPGHQPPFLRAQTFRFRARLAATGGDDPQATAGFEAAASAFREPNMPFWLAVTLTEHGEWLVGEGRFEEGEELLGESREIFDRLEARPWLERAMGATTRETTAVVVS